MRPRFILGAFLLLAACGGETGAEPPSPPAPDAATAADAGRDPSCDDGCQSQRPGFPFAYTTNPAPGLCVSFIRAEPVTGCPPLAWCCSDDGL